MKTLTLIMGVLSFINGNVFAQEASGNALFYDGNNALLFNGNVDYVQVGSDTRLKMTDSMTVEAWIFPTGPGSGGSGSGGIIVNKEGEYEFSRHADGTVRWAIANSSPGWVFINSGYVVPENQWVHFAIVYDMVEITTYINGDSVHSRAGSGNIGDVDATRDDFRIAGRQASSQYFDGFIDEVRIWNVARTQSQIQATLSDTLSPEYYTTADSGLVGYWRFDELEDFDINGDGADDVRDYSVSENHGDLVGDVSLLPPGAPLAVEDDGIQVPAEHILDQNYPNPFNPETTIQYSVTIPSAVQIVIFNQLGQKVRTLFNESLTQPGTYSLTWDGKGDSGKLLPTGSYFYQIRTRNFTSTKRAILLK